MDSKYTVLSASKMDRKFYLLKFGSYTDTLTNDEMLKSSWYDDTDEYNDLFYSLPDGMTIFLNPHHSSLAKYVLSIILSLTNTEIGDSLKIELSTPNEHLKGTIMITTKCTPTSNILLYYCETLSFCDSYNITYTPDYVIDSNGTPVIAIYNIDCKSD